MSLLWKLGGIALACAAAYFLVTMYGGARYRQGKADSDVQWSQKVADAEKAKLAAYQQGVAAVQAGETVYHETVRDRIIPVTRTVIQKATEYAQTPDGASVCLPVERVQLLDAARSALFPPAPTAAPSGSGRPVPAYTTSREPGWVDDQGPGGTKPGAR